MVNLIVHGLIVKEGKVLLIKRSRIKRGKPNFNAERWDIPGGTVEMNEELCKAVVREVKEETNCTAVPGNILYDMYQYDQRKERGFLTLIYQMDIKVNNFLRWLICRV
ncbi:NUDIX domain-containing protein [Acetivibrio straminisolvens]|uniref:MutT/NudX family protein n=1 Tax=Acetivibrio straminisolvens JCM 21531 TaxID=1294263 RepID=W4V1Y3_9FIRM|nr:NUDIX domain-containing protein [Acetivibrio straminisolvens]GAE86749.1 MutT/NudX family protein [Acetivibrio straminisolvens JCM 21531]